MVWRSSMSAVFPISWQLVVWVVRASEAQEGGEEGGGLEGGGLEGGEEGGGLEGGEGGGGLAGGV